MENVLTISMASCSGELASSVRLSTDNPVKLPEWEIVISSPETSAVNPAGSAPSKYVLKLDAVSSNDASPVCGECLYSVPSITITHRSSVSKSPVSVNVPTQLEYPALPVIDACCTFSETVKSLPRILSILMVSESSAEPGPSTARAV